MSITSRKTYQVLGKDLRAILRDELNDARTADGTLTRPRVLALAEELHVAERTVWRLAEARDTEGRCQPRTPFSLTTVHREAIAACPSLKAAWRELRDNGIAVPSYVQWTRAVNSEDPAVLAGLRQGREAMHEKQAYMLIEAAGRNETWSIDHYYIPVAVNWPGYANPVTAIQTTVMDEKTRMVIAAVIWPKLPDAQQSLSVVAKAMHGFTTADGTFVGGRPGALKMDNGTELIGTTMTEGLINLRVTPTPARARAGWEKGKLERWHQTLGRECWALEAGWTGGPRNYEGRPILTVAPGDLPDAATVRRHLAEWVRVYNTERAHSSLGGLTPLDVWAADPTPVNLSRPGLLRAAMLTTTRKVRKEGVRIADVPFTHPVLTEHRDRELTVAYLPEDHTFVDIQLPDNTWVSGYRHQDLPAAAAGDLMRRRAAQERTVTNATRTARHLRGQRSADRDAADQQPNTAADTTPASATTPTPVAPVASATTGGTRGARKRHAAPPLPLTGDPLGAHGVPAATLLARPPRQARRPHHDEQPADEELGYDLTAGGES